MIEQLRYGKSKYLSFVLLDAMCLVLAAVLSVWFYLTKRSVNVWNNGYLLVIGMMVAVELLVTATFNTCNNVLRRGIYKEAFECLKHVAVSIVVLTFVLFSIKKGAFYSRVTLYLTYGCHYLFLLLSHTLLKKVFKKKHAFSAPAEFLVTTSEYAEEGLAAIESSGTAAKGLFLTDRTNEKPVNDAPVFCEVRNTIAYLCWNWIDKVLVFGPEGINVPDALLHACKQMEIEIHTAKPEKSIKFKVVNIRTSSLKNDNSSGLSFFEGEHDLPFKINSFYSFFEGGQDKQRGFHAHKQSWQFLFCPYGAVNVFIDTGTEKRHVLLDKPSVGLILHPRVWRDITWENEGSVLCVASSGHYDAEKLRDDYDEYLRFLQEKERPETIKPVEITEDEF